jgi:hypothetical protein
MFSKEDQKLALLTELKENHVGRSKAIRLWALSEIVGISKRETSKYIAQLRMEGEPIAASKEGNYQSNYFIPATAEEALACTSIVRSRFARQCLINKGMVAGFQKMFPGDTRICLEFDGIILYPRSEA